MLAVFGQGWGSSEYRFATEALRAGRNTGPFMGFIGVSCLLVAVVGIVVQFHPYGPHGGTARWVQIAVLATAVCVGLRWLLGRWPSHAYAIAYVAWADSSLAVFALTMATPEARISTTLYMAMLGIFAGFFLGARILFLHCAFCGVVIGVIVGWAMLSEPFDGFRLLVFYMPTLVWVALAPMGTIAVIGRGRHAIQRTARSADHDSLTGLRNRRGLYTAVAATLARRTAPATMVMAVCDMDRFKELNDRLGHTAGDAALIALANQMRSVAQPGDITARIGGDELVLVAFFDDPDASEHLLQRLTTLTRIDVEGAAPTASVGMAASATDDPHFSVDDVLSHADVAMYEAKRAGGGRCVVYRRATTTSPEDVDPDHSQSATVRLEHPDPC